MKSRNGFSTSAQESNHGSQLLLPSQFPSSRTLPGDFDCAWARGAYLPADDTYAGAFLTGGQTDGHLGDGAGIYSPGVELPGCRIPVEVDYPTLCARPDDFQGEFDRAGIVQFGNG